MSTRPYRPRPSPSEDEPSPCQSVPDKECDSRKDCTMPDGTRCPAYVKPHAGRRA